MTTIDLISGPGDCYGAGDGSFSATATYMFLGGIPGGNPTADWMPFVTPLPRGIIIQAATLHLAAAQTRSDLINIRIGCEAADNPATPSSADDVMGRVQTTNYLQTYVENWVAGQVYTFDVTAAVQEVINRAGWTYNNTLAILIKRQSSPALGNRQQAATTEHASYDPPKLTIVVDPFVPLISGIL